MSSGDFIWTLIVVAAVTVAVAVAIMKAILTFAAWITGREAEVEDQLVADPDPPTEPENDDEKKED